MNTGKKKKEYRDYIEETQTGGKQGQLENLNKIKERHVALGRQG